MSDTIYLQTNYKSESGCTGQATIYSIAALGAFEERIKKTLGQCAAGFSVYSVFNQDLVVPSGKYLISRAYDQSDTECSGPLKSAFVSLIMKEKTCSSDGPGKFLSVKCVDSELPEYQECEDDKCTQGCKTVTRNKCYKSGRVSCGINGFKILASEISQGQTNSGADSTSTGSSPASGSSTNTGAATGSDATGASQNTASGTVANSPSSTTGSTATATNTMKKSDANVLAGSGLAALSFLTLFF